ncbi:MAG: Ig-like domain-containing protein [Vicinamibacterales bacterium]
MRRISPALAAAAGVALCAIAVLAGSLSSLSPQGASPGVAITFVGTGLSATAGQNDVTFRAGGNAVTVAAANSAVVDASKGTRRLTVTVPGGLPVGPASIEVLNKDTGEISGGVTMDVLGLELPGTRDVAPGTTASIVIAGLGVTKFDARTRVTVGAGVTASGMTVQSPTQLTLNVTAAASAAIGPRTITVQTTTQTITLPNVFQVRNPAPPNQAPVVTASTTTPTVTLPNGASLSGTVTDDGLPTGATVTTQWTQLSGPGATTFANAASATTTATFSVAGSYVLRLTASDTDKTAFADVSITVNPAPPVNQAPVVTASTTTPTVTLPNGASLSGTVTDDGLPTGATVTTQWTQLSGPGTTTFANAASATTTATFSVAGSYVLRLTASDTDKSAFTDVTITVNPAPPVNQAPVVTASTTTPTVTLPNGASLTGTVTDDGLPTGATVTTQWTQLSGPGTTTFANAASATTTATFSVAGSYVLRLTVSDTDKTAFADVSITVNPAASTNSAPVVTASATSPVVLPATSILNGRVQDDGLPSGAQVSSQWQKVSGPGQATFGSASSAATTVAFDAPGTYVLRLTATDGEKSSSAELQVTASAAPAPVNLAPVVAINAPGTTTLPASAHIIAIPTDDGLPRGSSVSGQWSFVSGPGTASFANAQNLDTTATFSQPGTYVLRFTVSDGELSGTNDATIVVKPAPAVNQRPAVSAGANMSTILPSPLTLEGTASDDGLPGQPLTIQWTKVSGPGTVTFSPADALHATVAFSQPGTYTLRLTGNDGELTASDDVDIVATVPAITNLAPSVDAGADQTIASGASALLAGTTSDDGQPGPLSLAWTKVSGPGTVSFTAPSAASTQATFTAPGVYVLMLSASDGQLTTTDDVAVTVTAPTSTVDRAPPVITLSAPRSALPGATVRVYAQASDDIGLAGVTLEFEGQPPVSLTGAPFAASFNAPQFAAPGQQFTLRGTATDAAGNASQATATLTISATPDTTAPEVSLKAPAVISPGKALRLVAKATDDAGIASVVFSVGGVDVVTDDQSPYEATYIVPAAAPVGTPITARARATDTGGNAADSTASVDVIAATTPVPPQITLTVPATAAPGDAITLLADATDLDGIAHVVFTQGAAELATDDSSPFSTTFTIPASAVPGGSIAFTATATDLTDTSATDSRSVQIVSRGVPIEGVLTGEVYDDTTSLPIANASIALTGADVTGVPYSATATTDARGRFVLTAVAGTGVLQVRKTGWTAVDRAASIVGGDVRTMFDARLSPLGPSTQSLSSAGGDLTAAGSTASFAPGTVPTSPVRFTPLTPQGLAGLLPTGWTPIGVAELSPRDATLGGSVLLQIKRASGAGAVAPQLVRWDDQQSAWRLVGAGQSTADGAFLQASVDRAGQFAFVVADAQPVAPPMPSPNGLLTGVGAVTLPQTLATTITPAPKVIFYQPGVGSDVRTTVQPEGAVSSGATVAARLTEAYRFHGNASAAPEPMVQDLVLFQEAGASAPALGGALHVTPSLTFEALTLQQGVIGIDVLADLPAGGGTLARVQGGDFSTPAGQTLTIPPGAIRDGAVVSVSSLAVGDLGIQLPQGIGYLGGVTVSLSEPLTRSGVFSIPAPQGITNVDRILVVKAQELGGQTRAVLVGVAHVAGDRIVSDTVINTRATALEGVRGAGRYAFIQADGPIGFAGGVVTGLTDQPLGGALVTSDTFFVASVSNAVGGYLATAPASAVVFTAADLTRNDAGIRSAYLVAGQVTPLPLALAAQAPRVTSVTPTNGSKNVPLAGPIVVTFSEPVDPATVVDAISLSGPGGSAVPVTRALSQGNTILTVRSVEPLASNARYTFTLATTIKDLSGYALASALSVAFDSLDTAPPLPPAAGTLTASLPNAQGASTITGAQGTAGPTDRVFVDNLTRRTSAVALVQANGSFSTTILAGINDILQIRIVDAAGNETKAPLPAFRQVNADGSVSQAVSAQGGVVDGPNGTQAKIKPGTFPSGTIVTLKYVEPSAFPVQLRPEDTGTFTLDGAIDVDFGGQTPQLYVDLSLAPKGGETESTRWIVVAADEIGGQRMMNAIDTAKFRGGRITTASPPCPGVQASKVYGFVRSNQAVGVSYSNVFVGVGRGLLLGLAWNYTGGPFGLAPYGVHADPFSDAVCYPVLTSNVTLSANAVRVSIPADLLTPADRQIILKNTRRPSLTPNKVPRDVTEFTFDVEGETSDSFRVEASGVRPDGSGQAATQLLTQVGVSYLAPGRVRIRINPDPMTIAVTSFEVRNLTRDTRTVQTLPDAEPFAAPATGGNGDPFQVTIVDVLGRTRQLPQLYAGDDSLYGAGNLVLKAVPGSIDPTREELDAAGVGGPARTAVFVSDLTQPGVFQPIPADKIVKGGIKGVAFAGDPTHDYAILVKYDSRGDYLQKLPRIQIDVRNASTGQVLKTIQSFAPPPDEPQGLPDITDGDTRPPYVISGPTRLNNFDPSGTLVFTFNEAMNPDTLKSAFEVKDSAGRIVAGDVVVSGDDRVVQFVPKAAFKVGERYTVRIKGYNPANDPPPAGEGGDDIARDRRGNPLAEIALVMKPFVPQKIGSFPENGAENYGPYKDVVIAPPAPAAVNPNPNEPAPDPNPSNQGTNSSRPVYVTTGHGTFNLLSIESRDPKHLALKTPQDGPISRQQGTFIRNVAFQKTGGLGGSSGSFSGDLVVTTTFNANASRLDWYDVTRRNDTDTFDLLGGKILTENPDLAGFGNRNNTFFSDSALAKGVGILSGASGVVAYAAVERVGVLSADLGKNTPQRPQINRIKEGLYPGDFIDLAVADGSIFAVSRAQRELHVLDPGLGALAVLPLQLSGQTVRPTKIEVRTGLQIDKNHDGFIQPDEVYSYAFIAADQAMVMVDVTDPRSPRVTGVVPVPGTVRDIDVDAERRRVFITANGALVNVTENGATRQVDGYVAMVDVSDPDSGSLIDVDRDGLDDRVIWQQGASGVNGIRIDTFRGVLFVAGATLDTYAVYDLCCDLGVDLAPKPTATVTGDRLTLIQLEKKAVAQGLAQGIEKSIAQCGVQASDIKLLDLGSGSCIWKSAEECGSDYKPGLGTHDLAVFFAHDALLADAPGSDSGASCTVGKLSAEFIDPRTAFVKEIDVDGLKVRVPGITFAAYHLSELQLAQYNILTRDTTIPGQTLPDYGMGRQSLLMSHVLGGTWVDFVPGYGATFAGPSLNGVMAKLRQTRNLTELEGNEDARLAKYALAKGQVYVRIPGASSETSYFNSLYSSQITAAAAAGIKAALGVLVNDINGRERLLAVSLEAVSPPSLDHPVKTFGQDACLTEDPALDASEWPEVGCTSFDHYVASVAARTRRAWGAHPSLNGSDPGRPELFTVDRVRQVMRFYRVGAGFESIQSESDADAFIREVHLFVQWALDATQPRYDNVLDQMARDGNTQRFQRVQNRENLAGATIKELGQASLSIVPHIYNRGFSRADQVQLDMYVTRPGESTPAIADTSVTVSVDGGTENWADFRRNPDGTLVLDQNNAAQAQFSLGPLSQTASPGVLGWVAFAIDLPAKKQREANRQNNVGGSYFYMLDVGPAAQPPGTGGRVPSPVGDAILTGDDDCNPDPVLVITQGIRPAGQTTAFLSPYRLEVGQIAHLEVDVVNKADVGTTVTLCNTLNGRCESLGTIPSQSNAHTSIAVPTNVPATYDIITTAYSSATGVQRQSPYRVTIACTPYDMVPLSHDKSVASSVMRQGTSYRYFQVVNHLTGKPVVGATIKVKVTGDRQGTAQLTTDEDGWVGSYNEAGVFRRGVAIPFSFGSGGLEGTANVRVSLDRGDTTECGVYQDYTLSFTELKTTHTMSLGGALEAGGQIARGQLTVGGSTGLTFGVTRVEDRNGVRFSDFTLSHTHSLDASLKGKLVVEEGLSLGVTAAVTTPGAGGGFVGSIAGADSYSFNDIEHLNEDDLRGITAVLFEAATTTVPGPLTRFVSDQFRRQFAPRLQKTSRSLGLTVGVAGEAYALGRLKLGFTKNQDIPDGTGTSVVGAELTGPAASGVATITLSGAANRDNTYTGTFSGNLTGSARVGINASLREASDAAAREGGDLLQKKNLSFTWLSDALFGPDAADGGLGTNLDLAVSGALSITTPNFASRFVGTPPPTDANSFLALSTSASLSEAFAFGFHALGTNYTNRGAGSRFNYTFTTTSKDVYKAYFTNAPLSQTLLAGNQRFGLPEVSRLVGPLEVSQRTVLNAVGSLIAYGLGSGQFEQTVDYGNGIDFPFGFNLDGVAAGVEGAATVKTNQTASYPVRRGVMRNGYFFITEAYPTGLVNADAWGTLRDIARRYADPIVNTYVTRGHVTPVPDAGSVDVPGSSGLRVASADVNSIEAAAVPFTSVPGPAAPTRPDPMGLTGAADVSHFGVNGFVQYSSTQPTLTSPAHLTMYYTDDQVSAQDEQTLGLYRWVDSGGTGSWVLIPSTIDRTANRVEADVTVLGAFTLAPRLPSGSIGWTLVSASHDTSNPNAPVTTAIVQSTPILNNDGTNVGAGRTVTVRSLDAATIYDDEPSDLGTVLTPDAAPLVDGTQVVTDANGRVTLQIRIDRAVDSIGLEAFTDIGVASGVTTVVLP